MPFDSFSDHYRIASWSGRQIIDFQTTVDELRDTLPSFELRPFGSAPNDNPRMRAIVRMPTPQDPVERPVAAVSDKYALVQHRVLATWLLANLEEAGLGDPAPVGVTMTEYGERIRLTVAMPSFALSLEPDDRCDEGEMYRPELVVTNSVDRSAALKVLIKWRRLVCLNGMFANHRDSLRSIHHVTWTRERQVPGFMRARIRKDAAVFDALRRWRKIELEPETVQEWCEARLRKDARWTIADCARLWHIVATGYDGQVTPPAPGQKGPAPLAAWRVGQEREVPGVRFPIGTLFDLAQILTWITTNQRTVEMQMEGSDDVPRVVADFIRYARRR